MFLNSTINFSADATSKSLDEIYTFIEHLEKCDKEEIENLIYETLKRTCIATRTYISKWIPPDLYKSCSDLNKFH